MLFTTDFTPFTLAANSPHFALHASSLHSPLIVATPSFTLAVTGPVISILVLNFFSTLAWISASFGLQPLIKVEAINKTANKFFLIFIFLFFKFLIFRLVYMILCQDFILHFFYYQYTCHIINIFIKPEPGFSTGKKRFTPKY